MKHIYKIWVIISFIILLIIGYGLVNTFVSIKYEVEPSGISGNKDVNLEIKERLLNEMVLLLKIFGSYLIINISILLRWLFKNSLLKEE